MVCVRSPQTQKLSDLRRRQALGAAKPSSQIPGRWLPCLHLSCQVADFELHMQADLGRRVATPVDSVGPRPLHGGSSNCLHFLRVGGQVGTKSIRFLHFSSPEAPAEASSIFLKPPFLPFSRDWPSETTRLKRTSQVILSNTTIL